jgi:prephenate dehydratase
LQPPGVLVPAIRGGRGGSTAQTFLMYAFLIEAAGHVSDARMQLALAEASTLCMSLNVLGSFPRARRVL